MRERPCANCEIESARLVTVGRIENDMFCSRECFEEDQGMSLIAEAHLYNPNCECVGCDH